MIAGLFLLAVVSDRISALPPDVRSVVLPILFTGWPWMIASPSQMSRGSVLGTMLVSFLFGLAAARAPAALGPALAAAWLGWLRLGKTTPIARSPELALLLRTASAYSVFVFAVAYVPALGNFVRTTTCLVSKAETSVGAVLFPWDHHVLVLGPTAYGLGLLMLFALFAAFAVIMGASRPMRAFVVYFVVLVLMHLIYLLSTSMVSRGIHGLEEIHTLAQLDLDILFFAIALVPTTVLCRSLLVAPMEPAGRRLPWRTWTIPAAALVLACPLVPPRKSCRILFLDKNTLDFRVPNYESFGDLSGGMFGELESYLASLGHVVERADIGDKDLSRYDVLFIANLLDPLPHDELHRVWDFLRAGGGLILVADHTGGDQIQEPSNEVLAQTRIRVNFDTAVPRVQGWRRCMSMAPHCVTRSLRSHRQVWVWLGASLAVEGRAEPLLIGDRAFSDAGEPVITDVKRGHLGDLLYHPGEILSDVVLGATDRCGDGRVLVLGDTSPLQNGALSNSYGFVDHAVRWVTWHSFWNKVYDQRWILAVVLAVVGTLSLRHFGLHRLLPLWGISPLAAWLCAPLDLWTDPAPPVSSHVAWVDSSHQNRFDSTGWEGDSLGALDFNLTRAGFLPLTLWKQGNSNLDARGVMIVASPARRFGSGELDRLVDFVRRGGRLVLSAGWEDRDVVSPLLARFDLELSSVPLGTSSGDGPFGPTKFYRANPVYATEEREAPEILSAVGEYPVIVSRRLGAGRFVHIADSCFLKNENVEGRNGFVVRENIEFLRRLFAELHPAS